MHETYWSLTPEQLLAALHTTNDGLQQTDAESRIKQYGPNALKAQRQATPFGLSGKKLENSDIVTKGVRPPKAAAKLLELLNRYSAQGTRELVAYGAMSRPGGSVIKES